MVGFPPTYIGPVGALDRFERVCTQGLDDRALRVALLAELRRHVRFDAHAWLLTDPETWVGTAPLAEIPSLDDLPRLVRTKYLTSTNRWTSLPPNEASTLVVATAGERSRSRMWSELLAGYGIDDVASVVFRDQLGCWAFLDLWRRDGSFTAGDCATLEALARVVTPALRRSLAATFIVDERADPPHGEPVVLLLDDDLQPLTQTPQTDTYLRALLPTEADRSPVPAGAYNAAAQLLASEQDIDAHPPWARVHLRDGHWVTISAARMVGTARQSGAIAVTIEATSPAARTALYARVIGLTERETELLGLVVGGSDTRAIARRLFVSEHTVHDHLKSVFAKADTHSRRVLAARATGAR